MKNITLILDRRELADLFGLLMIFERNNNYPEIIDKWSNDIRKCYSDNSYNDKFILVFRNNDSTTLRNLIRFLYIKRLYSDIGEKKLLYDIYFNLSSLGYI